MTYLLDTNAISNLMRGDPGIEQWLDVRHEDDRVVTCTIVRGEILFGINRLPEGNRRRELELQGKAFLEDFECEPLPPRVADIYASLKTSRQAKGLALDENDLWIAATAIAIGATLVSRDKDFTAIDGLSVDTF